MSSTNVHRIDEPSCFRSGANPSGTADIVAKRLLKESTTAGEVAIASSTTDAPAGVSTETIYGGSTASYQFSGRAVVTSGGAITAGDQITTDSAGKAVVASQSPGATQRVWGVAKTAASGTGEDIVIELGQVGLVYNSVIAVATRAELKAIAATNRFDGMVVLVKTDESNWVFESAHAGTADTAEELLIAPSAGTGRWVRADTEISILKKIIDEFKPDLIHVFGSERSFGLIAAESEIPVILQIQGNLSAYTEKWFSGISSYDVFRYCRKKDLISGYGLFHGFYQFRKKAVRERKIFEICKYIIGRTEWDRRISRILAPQSCYFHCEELLRDQFYSKQWSYQPRAKKIFVSILSPLVYKGLETIIKSARLLKQGMLDFEWHVIGVKGKEEIISIIEHTTRLTFSENNIIFKGSLNPDELAVCLVESDCYIHPSHIENSPNSVCEAMIVGIPIIATFAGGTPSILKDGVEGILVQDGDPYALAGAILEIVNSPEQLMVYSEKSRQTALLRHDPVTVIQNLLSIYQVALENH